MKKAIIITLLFGFAQICTAQTNFECVVQEVSNLSSNKGTGHIEYGKVFTPKGDLRVLVVFVSYGETYDTVDMDGWPRDADLPNWVTNNDEKAFYTSLSEFSSDIYSDPNRYSVSNFYYQMSNGTFRIMADYYPHRVVVDVARTDDWGDINRKALQQIENDVDWSLYDSRTNWPGFQFDNSTSQPDGKADYIVFCHRFSWDWDVLPSDSFSNKDANGFNSTSSNYTMPNGYVVKDGFTVITGDMKIIGVFPHELGHSLYEGPHYGGGNNVVGKYFYAPSAGWGMMHLTQSYTCATAWERYILDWTPTIQANGQNSDIEDASDLNDDGIYVLRDFITTGDAIRIKVPTSYTPEGPEYLWIENHQCKSTFDGHYLGNEYCGMEIDEYKDGIIAYVETYSKARGRNSFTLSGNGNGVRWLSQDGNYDFTFDPEPIYPEALCPDRGNFSYLFHRGAPNPLGGQNVNECIRHDFNNDGHIGYNRDHNNTRHQNEHFWVAQLDSEVSTPKYFTGTGMQFQPGDKVGIARNPCVTNLQYYEPNVHYPKQLPLVLNGISFEILSKNTDGSMVVKIRVDDVEIDRNTRWAAANIWLKDINGISLPDVDVLPSVTVDIDKSGTPNMHKNQLNPDQTSSTIDDFVTPTTFQCQDRSFFKQEHGSTVNVKNQSRLVLEAGSVYEINDGAVLNIMSTGSLHVKSGATLRVKGAGHVEVQNGAYVCIEDGANIELVDELSAVNLRQGYQTGLNPTATPMEENGNCTTRPLTEFALAAQSQGAIHSFYMDNYIQNRNYTGNAYESGNKILAGHHITQQIAPGDVILEEGSHVILDADDEVRLEPGVEVQLGATLEVRCRIFLRGNSPSSMVAAGVSNACRNLFSPSRRLEICPNKIKTVSK